MKKLFEDYPSVMWTDIDIQIFKTKLVDVLKEGIVTVTFTKKDGTKRVMRCTLDPRIIPSVDSSRTKAERKKSNAVLPVYDVSEKGWRSFQLHSINVVEG